ncbi:MAG: hypothetical protein RR854_06015, partial [Muribaculaceae bacterium]
HRQERRRRSTPPTPISKLITHNYPLRTHFWLYGAEYAWHKMRMCGYCSCYWHFGLDEPDLQSIPR